MSYRDNEIKSNFKKIEGTSQSFDLNQNDSIDNSISKSRSSNSNSNLKGFASTTSISKSHNIINETTSPTSRPVISPSASSTKTSLSSSASVTGIAPVSQRPTSPLSLSPSSSTTKIYSPKPTVIKTPRTHSPLIQNPARSRSVSPFGTDVQSIQGRLNESDGEDTILSQTNEPSSIKLSENKQIKLSQFDDELQNNQKISELNSVTDDSFKNNSISNDLTTATAGNPAIVMELDLDCNVLFLSKSWENLIGTKIGKILKRPISDLIVGNNEDKSVFNRATSIMMIDDESYRVKFSVRTNLLSASKKNSIGSISSNAPETEAFQMSKTTDNKNNNNNTNNNNSQPTDSFRNDSIVPSYFLSGANDSVSTNNNNTQQDIEQSHISSTSSSPSESSMKDIESLNKTETQSMRSSIATTRDVMSQLLTDTDDDDADDISIHSSASSLSTDGGCLEIEAQGVIITDPKTNKPSHSMWILKPWKPLKEITLQLPMELVSNLGFCVNLLESYLFYLTDLAIIEEEDLPPPSKELCRICEQQVPNWWLESHSDLCLVRHRAADTIQLKQDNLKEQKDLIQSIYDTLYRKLQSSSTSSPSSSPPVPLPSPAHMSTPGSPPTAPVSPSTSTSISSASVQGQSTNESVTSPVSPSSVASSLGISVSSALLQNATTGSPTSTSATSPVLLASNSSPIASSTTSSTSSSSSTNSILSNVLSTTSNVSVTDYKGIPLPLTHSNSDVQGSRRKSSAPNILVTKRFPFRNLHNLIQYCEEGLKINSGEIKVDKSSNNYMVAYSPSSKKLIKSISEMILPDSSDPAIKLITEDTQDLVTQKLDSLDRYAHILEYEDRITRETDEMVLKIVKETVQRIRERVYYSDLEDDDNLNNQTQQSDQSEQRSNNRYLQTPQAHPQQSLLLEHSQLIRQPSLTLQSPKPYTPSPQVGSKSILDSEPDFGYTTMTLKRSQSQHSMHRGSFNSSILRSQASTPDRTSKNHGSHSHSHHSTSSGNLSQSQSQSQLQQSIQGSNNSSSSNLNRLTPSINIYEAPPTITTGEYPESERKSGSNSHKNLNSPRRPLSPTYPVSLSSIHRNSKSIKSNHLPNSSVLSTPTSSPLLLSTDFGQQHGMNSLSLDKPQLSPLLVPTAPSKPAAPSIKDYEIIKPISKGAFGSVFLAKRKLTGEYFAIKVLKKADMIAKNQVTNVKAERAIMMAQADSPYVAQLFATFQSSNYLYLVMEYLNGGDCATLVKNMGYLPDVWAKRYISEVIIGVDDLHKKGIVHRDLKPDNLLIDHSGHIKLTDFGLSRMGLIRRQKRIAEITGTSSVGSSGAATPSHLITNANLTSHNTNNNSNEFGATLASPTTVSRLAVNNKSMDGLFEDPFNSPTVMSTSVFNQHNLNSSNSNTSKLHHHKRLLSITPFSLNNNSINSANSNSSMLSSPLVTPVVYNDSNTFNDSDTNDDTSSTKSRRQSSASGVDSPVLRPLLRRNSSHTSFILSNDDTANVNEITDYALFHPSHSTENRKFVGTPDYLAPETVAGISQDEVSDRWSIGCILFEFLFGYPPFTADSAERVFENILHGEIQWPELPEDEFKEYCSDNAKDLISKLLVKDPTQRLGIGGTEEIIKHPYFNGINWDSLFVDEASFVPDIEDPESTDYFDDRGAAMHVFPRDDDDEEDTDEEDEEETEDENALSNNDTTTDFLDRSEDILPEANSTFEARPDLGSDILSHQLTNSNIHSATGIADQFVIEDNSHTSSGTTSSQSPQFLKRNSSLSMSGDDAHLRTERDARTSLSITRANSSSSSATLDSPRASIVSKSSHAPHSLSTPIQQKSKERRGSKLVLDSSSEFGSFNFRNLSVLDKQNKDTINRLKNEHMEHRSSFSSNTSSISGETFSTPLMHTNTGSSFSTGGGLNINGGSISTSGSINNSSGNYSSANTNTIMGGSSNTGNNSMTAGTSTPPFLTNSILSSGSIPSSMVLPGRPRGLSINASTALKRSSSPNSSSLSRISNSPTVHTGTVSAHQSPTTRPTSLATDFKQDSFSGNSNHLANNNNSVLNTPVSSSYEQHYTSINQYPVERHGSLIPSLSQLSKKPVTTPLTTSINTATVNTPGSVGSGGSGSGSGSGGIVPTAMELGSPASRLLNMNFSRTASEFSASSSDNEDKNSAISRVRKRRSSRKMFRGDSNSGGNSMSGMSNMDNKDDNNTTEHSDRSGSRTGTGSVGAGTIGSSRLGNIIINYFDVLLCEPIPIHRYSIERNLSKLGCEVVSIAGGSELVKRCTGNIKFDIIFTSTELHKLDCVSLIKLIKHTNSVNSDTCIVGLTSFYSDAQKSGVFDYIIEYPVTMEKLRRVLDEIKTSTRERREEALVSDTESAIFDS
ncbi:hypothetical protein B5S31_g3854 [[Candida] boidinii]|nr:hypothetical protein B5S31_g3854 [[Candida] boidinii]